MSMSRIVRITNRFLSTPIGVIIVIGLMLLFTAVYFTIDGRDTQQKIEATTNNTKTLVSNQQEQIDTLENLVKGQQNIIKSQSNEIRELKILTVCILVEHGEFGIVSDENLQRCQEVSTESQQQAQQPPQQSSEPRKSKEEKPDKPGNSNENRGGAIRRFLDNLIGFLT